MSTYDKKSNDKNDGAEKNELIERLVSTSRVAKTTKGGRNMSFTALVVVGDQNGTVGIGYGKAKEVPAAVQKAVSVAKKSLFKVPRIQGTITHPVQGEEAAGVVFLRPASPGTGVIAGGPVRAVLECAGYTDVLTKSLGSSNAKNIVRATAAALRKLENPEAVAARRGKSIEEVAPAALLRAQAAGLKDKSAQVVVEEKKEEAPKKAAPAKKAPAKAEKAAAKEAPKAEKAPAEKKAPAKKAAPKKAAPAKKDGE